MPSEVFVLETDTNFFKGKSTQITCWPYIVVGMNCDGIHGEDKRV